MATGLGIIGFDGVGLNNSDGVYRKANGGGESVSVQSRLITLAGGGSFDPDTGVDRTPTDNKITENYRVQAVEATARAKVSAIKAKVGATGLLTRGDASTLTGRLVAFSQTNVQTGNGSGNAIYDLSLTWEIPT